MKRWKEFRFEYLRTAAVFLLLCAMACTLIWALPAQVHADYTEPYMKRMEELGLLQGDADGDLRPGDPITRAEFVVMLNRGTSHLFTEGRIHTRLLQRALSQSQAEKTLQCEGNERELMLIYSCLMVGFLVKWASAASDSDFDWHSLLSREMRLMFVRPPEITDVFNAP